MDHSQKPTTEAGAPDDAHGSNISDLDVLAAAADSDSGDAKKAWCLLAAGIDQTGLPLWVKTYIQKSAKLVAAYDVENGDQAHLAHMLGFYKETPHFTQAVYDRDHVLEWFTDRMMSDARGGLKPNVSRIAREYRDEFHGNSMASPDSIRKAYEAARSRFSKLMANDLEFQKLLAERDYTPE